MHANDLSAWTHSHVFDTGSYAAERGTKAVMWITAAMMVAEIWAGWWFNSMALLADGWHMSSHALAIGLSALAYVAARRYARDERFAFGTWKIEVLAGFASALLLLVIAILMAVASVERLIVPQQIHFREAIAVAVVGLILNVVCALILGRAHDDNRKTNAGHEHAHAHHDHAHEHHRHRDLNLRSAYLHVTADAATSVLAILALVGGSLLGLIWLDPAVGIIGSILVANWARGLLRDTGRVLLDREMDHPVAAEVRAAIAGLQSAEATRIADLHVWRVGKAKFACIVSVVTDDAALTPARVKAALRPHEELVHVTVEIHHCTP